jgi:peptide/nickel transport system substrate-binding protein
VTWQDGSEVTCEDVKYGVSRTFASDVINQGPTYASAYLDIPANPVTDEDDPNSAFPTAYYGPYHGTGQEHFDQAVTCDGKTITFNLKSPHADFNYTVTLGFSPVPNPDDHPGIDTGETYGTTAPYVFSNGPYMVESYTTGNGGSYVLVRNPEWNADSDPIRPAYPDSWVVHFGVDPLIIDQRLMESAGEDANAVQYGDVQPENLDTIFADPETANPDFAGRAISGFDPYSLYYWIANDRITNVKIRQAMGVALDREALRLNAGGNFAGDFADGAVKPNIGQDYAPTNLWSAAGPFGVDVPPTGDPALAQTLIQESGEAAPELVFCHPDTPVNGRAAAIVIESLGRAGLTVTANAIESGRYYSVVYDTEGPCHFGSGGWGADWPNASTVIEPLFHSNGGWPLARVNDADFDAGVEAALSELDRGTQATMWQELNTTASEQMWHIPTLFGRSQTLAGNGVGPDPLYRWPAYGSWPYGIMYVK